MQNQMLYPSAGSYSIAAVIRLTDLFRLTVMLPANTTVTQERAGPLISLITYTFDVPLATDYSIMPRVSQILPNDSGC